MTRIFHGLEPGIMHGQLKVQPIGKEVLQNNNPPSTKVGNVQTYMETINCQQINTPPFILLTCRNGGSKSEVFKFGSSPYSDQIEQSYFDVLTILNNRRRPSMEETGAYKDINTLFCPTCRKPRNEVLEAAEDDFAVLRCLNCDTALAAGKFVGFRAVCPNCGQLVVVS